MSMFLMVATLILLTVLALLLRPLLRANAASAETESPALAVLREQRRELEADFAAGRVSDAAYSEGMAELAQRTAREMAPQQALVGSGPARGWALGLGVSLPLAAIGLYLVLGQPAGLDPANLKPVPQFGAQDIEIMVNRLAAKVAANPDDLEGVQMLGRSYMVLQRFEDAAGVFAQLAKRRPQDAQVYADWADALGSVPGQGLAGEPARLIDKALQLDPDNIKALALAGTVAFDAQDYKGALKHWERMAARVDPQSEIGRNAEGMIAEARARAGLPVPQKAAEPAPGKGLAISGRVTLDPALQDRISPEDVLFVFARHEAGGPPIAALRLRAADLPLDFDLAQAALMGAAPGEGPFTVTARVSKTGQPGAQRGDLEGTMKVLRANDKGLVIKIDRLVQ